MTEISLREFLETRITEMSKLDDTRWKSHDDAHKLMEKAGSLASADLLRRLEEMNQFRQQINEERNLMVAKDYFFARLEQQEKKFEAMIVSVEVRLAESDKWRSNMDGRFWMLGAVVTVVSLLGNIAVRLLFK